jgi:nitroreductase
MNTIDAILTRRSIRKFTDQPVSPEMIRGLLEAAMSAPSAGNEQPWQFIVLTERQTLDAIPSFHPYAAMVRDVSVAIVVCGDVALEKYKGFWVQDCSAATQNILLAAHEMGLGAVWTGIYPMEERVEGMRRLLGLPEHVIPLALIPIGYPAQKAGRQDRFREERIHNDRWG